jgi:hypothetical protein
MGRTLAIRSLLVVAGVLGSRVGHGGEPGAGRLLPPPEHTMERAGCPLEASCLAKPGRGPKYDGGYVGGGCLLGGAGRGPLDGTWGWDYTGCGCWPHRIFLSWCGCRGRKPLAGYRADGPPVPDIFAVPVRKGSCTAGQP